MKRVKRLVLVLVVVLLILGVANVGVASAGSFYSYWFNLNGWNGPLYISMTGNCPGGVTVNYPQSGGSMGPAPITRSGNTWYAWPTTSPNVWYEFHLICWDGGATQYKGYYVRYFGGTVQANQFQ